MRFLIAFLLLLMISVNSHAGAASGGAANKPSQANNEPQGQANNEPQGQGVGPPDLNDGAPGLSGTAPGCNTQQNGNPNTPSKGNERGNPTNNGCASKSGRDNDIETSQISLSGHTFSQAYIGRLGRQFGELGFARIPSSNIPLMYAALETETLSDVIDYPSMPSISKGLWFKVNRFKMDYDRSSYLDSGEYRTNWFTVGIDREVGDNGTIGVMAAYGRSDVDAEQTNIDMDSYMLGIYGG